MKIYKSRATITLSYAGKGKRILDLGCVGMGANDIIGGEDNIFGKLQGYVIGLDINNNGVKELNKLGYTAKVQDLNYNYDLHAKFDIVISEENIEHISNLKIYLEAIKKHLKKDGILLLTTPNAMCLDFMFHTLIWGHLRVNLNHTHLHSQETIKHLLESEGFKIVELKIIQAINWKTTNTYGKIMSLILRLLPSKFGRTIFVVAKLK